MLESFVLTEVGLYKSGISALCYNKRKPSGRGIYFLSSGIPEHYAALIFLPQTLRGNSGTTGPISSVLVQTGRGVNKKIEPLSDEQLKERLIQFPRDRNVKRPLSEIGPTGSGYEHNFVIVGILTSELAMLRSEILEKIPSGGDPHLTLFRAAAMTLLAQ